jgi:hypothetical protein
VRSEGGMQKLEFIDKKSGVRIQNLKKRMQKAELKGERKFWFSF